MPKPSAWGAFAGSVFFVAWSVVAGAAASAVQTQTPPAVETAAPPARFLVVPGQGIGPLRLGMRLQDVEAALGPPQSTWAFLDGSVYRWFREPRNAGLGVGVTVAGVVDRIWALNDPGYSTADGLHAGSTEAQVLSALGVPSRSLTDSRLHMKKLIYSTLGVWFSVQLDRRYAFYNQVFEVGVIEPSL